MSRSHLQPRDALDAVLEELAALGVREPSQRELRALRVRFCDNTKAWMVPPTVEALRPQVEHFLGSLRVEAELAPNEVESLVAELPDPRQRRAFIRACESQRWTRGARAAILHTALGRIRDAHSHELVGAPNASPSFLVEPQWIKLGRELGF